jgi:hypothetical protein
MPDVVENWDTFLIHFFVPKMNVPLDRFFSTRGQVQKVMQIAKQERAL